jgi:hypothetical protein
VLSRKARGPCSRGPPGARLSSQGLSAAHQMAPPARGASLGAPEPLPVPRSPDAARCARRAAQVHVSIVARVPPSQEKLVTVELVPRADSGHITGFQPAQGSNSRVRPSSCAGGSLCPPRTLSPPQGR